MHTAPPVMCAYHPGRTALGYCGSCGKALCTACLVRLSSGNFCEVCTASGGGPAPAKARRGIPWWALLLLAAAVLILLRALIR
jgi:hypothetical protein